MIDLTILRILKYKSEFYRIKGRVPEAAMDAQTNAIIKDFAHYFTIFPDHDKVDHATFVPVFRARHPTLTTENKAAYDTILSNALTVDVSDTTKEGIMGSLLELRLGTDMAHLLAQWDAGELPNIQAALSGILDSFKKDSGIKGQDYLRDDIGDLLQQEADDTGLRWRLECLNDAMRGLRPGDFGILAGRPDKGKTTLVSSELTCLAPQLPDGQCALWLNNEGPGKRIIPRLYQAALGMTVSELVHFNNKGTLKDMYAETMGMLDRIRIVDVHGMDNFTVEGIIEKNAPGIVVYDMIDKIRGFADSARTDLALEQMYDWGRDIAVKYEMAGIATSQISNEGDGLQFPTLGMLKDSKTGKQGACDFQLMIGASNDPGLSGVRYLGLPKNKLRREGNPQDPRATVQFSPQRARFEDIPFTAEDAADATDTPSG